MNARNPSRGRAIQPRNGLTAQALDHAVGMKECTYCGRKATKHFLRLGTGQYRCKDGIGCQK